MSAFYKSIYWLVPCDRFIMGERAHNYDPNEHNPWEPQYDKAFGFVVAAEDELSARILCNGDAGDEGKIWTDVDRVNCIALAHNAWFEDCIFVRDFRSA